MHKLFFIITIWQILHIEGTYVLYKSFIYDNKLYVKDIERDNGRRLTLYNLWDYSYIDIDMWRYEVEVTKMGVYFIKDENGVMSNYILVNNDDIINSQLRRRNNAGKPIVYERQLKVSALSKNNKYFIEVMSHNDLNNNFFTYEPFNNYYKSKKSYSVQEVEAYANMYDKLDHIISIIISPEQIAFEDHMNRVVKSNNTTPNFRRTMITPQFTHYQSNYLGENGINYYNFQELTNNQFKGQAVTVHIGDGGFIPHEDLENIQIVSNVECYETEKTRFNCHHGTASAGIISATNNGFGIVGIAHQATAYYHDKVPDSAIGDNLIRKGDILSISMGLTIEPLIGAAYYRRRLAQLLDRGVIVVIAAGNENTNLKYFGHEGMYNVKNIILASSATPQGEKENFANYNSPYNRIYTLGAEITTTGYGGLQINEDDSKVYTDHYAGTSASTPIISGALAIIQDYAIRTHHFMLTAAEVVDIFEDMGRTEVPYQTQVIGAKMDLVEMKKYVDGLRAKHGMMA